MLFRVFSRSQAGDWEPEKNGSTWEPGGLYNFDNGKKLRNGNFAHRGMVISIIYSFPALFYHSECSARSSSY
jgi:hypothetical protein